MTHNQRTERIPQLDGLRGIAILLVVIWHYCIAIINLNTAALPLVIIARTFSLFWSGVDLFFVLSGFLIGGILLDNQNGRFYFKTFYIRRVCRIFPLYFIWLLVFAIVLYFIPPSSLFVNLLQDPLPFWSYLTFTQNFLMAANNRMGVEWLAVTWSLAIEEQFYLLLPAFIHVVNSRKLPGLLLLLILTAPVLRLFLIQTSSNWLMAAWLFMPCRMDGLLLGVLCAWCLRQLPLRHWLTQHIRFLYYAFIILFAGTATFAFITPPGSLSVGMLTVGYTWLACFYAIFLLLVILHPQGILSRLTQIPFLQHMGFIAYGVYLLHQVVNGLAHSIIFNHPPQFQTFGDGIVALLAFTLTIMLASLSWKFFEKRFVKFGHTFQYQ